MPESCSASVLLRNTLLLISCKLLLIPRMCLTFCTLVVVQGLVELTTY